MAKRPPRVALVKSSVTPAPAVDAAAVAADVIAEMWEGRSLARIAKARQTSRGALHRLIEAHIPPDQYARAREAQGDHYAEQLDEIRERVLSGELEPNAARVAMDALKWQAAKFHRNRYGEKMDTTVSAPDGGPVQVQHEWVFGDRKVSF